MVKYLEVLKNNNLVDEKGLWAKGQVYTLIKSATNVAINERFFSVKGEELIVSRISGKTANVTIKYSKANVANVIVKNGFFGLLKRLTLQLKNGEKHIYDIGMNKNVLPQIIEILK